MTHSESDLRAASCWFAADRVPGDKPMTDFKREARLRQHLWAEPQVAAFGGHRNSRARIAAGGPERITSGTKLTAEDAGRGLNFLSPTIREVVEARLAAPQPHQTINTERLHGDLLSSMPMAFNLFGEASRQPASLAALAALLAPGAAGPADLVFEWSPGRRDPDYTNDRTAFDVALLIGDGPRTVVGIETKYHEHPTREALPTSERGRANYERQTKHLTRIAEDSGAFRPGWDKNVLDTPLRQIWRDHLLALSMRQHPDRWTDRTRYVLIYPRRNPAYAEAAAEYARQLAPGDASFTHVTVEDLIDAAFAHGGPTKERFVQRYLW